MMHLLPTASRIGFTGTPLLADDHITERTFGGYLSVYDFKRAVEDGATVPLYYENARIRSPSWTSRRSPGGSWMPLKLPTLILRRRKSWNASCKGDPYSHRR